MGALCGLGLSGQRGFHSASSIEVIRAKSLGKCGEWFGRRRTGELGEVHAQNGAQLRCDLDNPMDTAHPTRMGSNFPGFSCCQDRRQLHAKLLLAAATYDSSPTWSPDGRWIVYTAEDDSRDINLRILNVSTGATSALMSGTGINVDPVWSADGTRKACVGVPQLIGQIPGIFERIRKVVHRGRLHKRDNHNPLDSQQKGHYKSGSNLLRRMGNQPGSALWAPGGAQP